MVSGLVSEKDFLRTVLEYAQLHGWKVHHIFESRQYARRTDKGFPDLVVAKRKRLVFAELKSQRGPVTADQKDWLELLKTVRGARTFLWRPSDWQEIEQVLGERPETA